MIGIDTNILVRYLIQDDLAQSKIASNFIEQADSEGESLFINTIVLCEIVWVLERAYHVRKHDLCETIETLLAIRNLDFEDKDVIRAALAKFRSERAGFADYLILEKNRSAGCALTITFDTAAASSPGFKLLCK